MAPRTAPSQSLSLPPCGGTPGTFVGDRSVCATDLQDELSPTACPSDHLLHRCSSRDIMPTVLPSEDG